MKPRTLLTLALVSAMPSAALAQVPPASWDPALAQVVPAPKPARAPRAVVAPALASAWVEAPPALPVPEAPQARPVPKVAPVPAIPSAPEIPQVPATPKVAPAPPAPAIAPAPPRPPGQLLNVQIEVTLSDSKGSPKTVVLTVADGELGQNRTMSDVLLAPNGAYKSFGFNADARPTIAGNKVRLYLSAEATVPASDAKAGSAANISLRQSQTLILNDGDSVEIARAADPVSERAFALSVKVKIQR